MNSNFFIFIFLVIVSHVAVWMQLNLQFIYKFKINITWLILAGIPISYMWIKATKYGVLAFNGKFWPQRFIAFSIGIVLYTIFTSLFFNEKIDLKSLISILLAFSIVAIQIFWNTK